MSLAGRLLIASPALLDPNFRRAVVLVVEHADGEGAAGVVLNRPSDTAIHAAAPMLSSLAEPDDRVFIGGPVEPDAVSVLAAFADPGWAEAIVTGDIGVVPGEADLEEISDQVLEARVFAGYAGWSPGQLEEEVEQEQWIVEPSLARDILSPEPDDLWRDVLRRKGGWHEVVARMPDDPRAN